MATDIITTVQNRAKKIAKRETQTFPAGAAPGDTARQGDVYITLLDKVPAGCIQQKRWDLQLASGSTQGSRHILDSRKGVKCYALQDATEFDGPVLSLEETRELTHPEHGNWILPPGIYGISYQRTQDALDQQRRVAD
jgi:hypothetical protein